MRLIILFALMLIPASAFATPVSKNMATAYYESCLKQPTPGMSAQGQNNLCACTAAQMMKSMSVEEVRMMEQKDQAGRAAFNKMIINVYAPCMEFPAREYYFNACASNPQTQKMTKNVQGLCTCLSDQMASYLKANSRSVFQDLLMRNPNMMDPMGALTSDPKFEKFAQSKLLGCVR